MGADHVVHHCNDGQVIAAPNVDALGRLLERVASYHAAAPMVWWTFVGLGVLVIAGWTLRGIFGRRKEGP